MYTYKTKGTCSERIEIELEGDVIQHVTFYKGCQGNLNAVAKLVEGMKVDDAIARLSGIPCGANKTSCPDQLAQALIQMKGA